MSKINWKNKCWVTTVFLVNRENKVLLNWNKVLQTWIPVGGHIDKGETPMEAIIREVEEEIGADFELYGDFTRENDGKIEVVKLHRSQMEAVPHHGLHMNFVFFGRLKSISKKVKATDEEERLRWFTKEDILNQSGMWESVKKPALAAIDMVRF